MWADAFPRPELPASNAKLQTSRTTETINVAVHDEAASKEVVNDRFGASGSSPASLTPPNEPSSSGSFDDRFGRWGSAPADDPDNPRSPLLRELMKRRKSAAADVPASSTAAFEIPGSTFGRLLLEAAQRAGNEPAQPLSPPGSISSSPRLATFNDRFGEWPSPSPPKPAQIDPRDVRVLSSRVRVAVRAL